LTSARPPLAYRVHLKIAPGYRGRLDPILLRAAARAALTHQGAPTPGELTLLIAGDSELQTLNRKFLGHNRPTDVLSFPSGERDPASGRLYLGDIAIAYPQARASALRGGHPIKAELQLLIVHGVLHLLGHDHAKKSDKSRMWSAQAEILRQLDAAITGPVED
jgi:probable rRNA maturation factor